MGADAVQMGTRFVATDECDADIAFKQTYIDAKEEDVVIIKSPVGLPGQAIRNEFLDEVSAGKKTVFKCPYHCVSTCNYKEAPYCIGSALANAKKGKLKHGFAFAGKNAYRVDKIMSVKELIDLLKAQYAACCT
jgi:nitronate monooxygenase